MLEEGEEEEERLDAKQWYQGGADGADNVEDIWEPY